MKAKLVIFDLDGTLLDTVEDLGGAVNYGLSSLGFPERPMEQYKTLVGRGIYNLFRSALPPRAASDENVARMATLFLPYYDEHKTDHTKPYDGVCKMLECVVSAGVAIALASNKYQEGAEKLVNHFFGQFSFHKILGQREGLPIKPDPAIVDQCMEGLNIGKDAVVYVGDSNVDMQTGANAGVRTIGVTWGFRSRSELEACAPDCIVDSPRELAAAILE